VGAGAGAGVGDGVGDGTGSTVQFVKLRVVQVESNGFEYPTVADGFRIVNIPMLPKRTREPKLLCKSPMDRPWMPYGASSSLHVPGAHEVIMR
jgi:hypothetical protein